MRERKHAYLKLEALEEVRNSKTLQGEAKAAALSKAIDLYRQYLDYEKNVDDDDAWAGLGGAYRRVENIDRAIDCYREAYRLNPESTYALVNLVSLLGAQGNPEDSAALARYSTEAQTRLGKAVENGTADHWTHFDIATMSLIQGKTGQALDWFVLAAGKTPAGASEHFNSVLSNLEFLAAHNPAIPGIADAIVLVTEKRDSHPKN